MRSHDTTTRSTAALPHLEDDPRLRPLLEQLAAILNIPLAHLCRAVITGLSVEIVNMLEEEGEQQCGRRADG